MDVIKFFLGVAVDPITHIFLFVLLIMVYKPMRKLWVYGFVYLFVMATPLAYKLISYFWSVPNKINYNNTYDYIFLLTGVTDYKWHLKYTPNDRNRYCNLNQNGGRIGYVLREMRSGYASNLLIGRNVIAGFDEAACIVDLLSQQGISSERVLVLGHVDNTLDELTAVGKWLNDTEGGDNIIMVTTANHMRRAVAFSEKLGLMIDYNSVNKIHVQFSILEIIPSSKWLEKNRQIFYEIGAYIGYKLSGDL